jgi:hypothetical protein
MQPVRAEQIDINACTDGECDAEPGPCMGPGFFLRCVESCLDGLGVLCYRLCPLGCCRRGRWLYMNKQILARWLFAASLGLIPFAGGCLLGDPVISETRGVDLGSDPKEIADVRAFRIHSTVKEAASSIPVESRRLSMVAPVCQSMKRGGYANHIPAQRFWGVAANLWTTGRLESESISIALCLYRRGYELIVVVPESDAAPITWKPAADLGAQEAVLGALFYNQRSCDASAIGLYNQSCRSYMNPDAPLLPTKSGRSYLE